MYREWASEAQFAILKKKTSGIVSNMNIYTVELWILWLQYYRHLTVQPFLTLQGDPAVQGLESWMRLKWSIGISLWHLQFTVVYSNNTAIAMREIPGTVRTFTVDRVTAQLVAIGTHAHGAHGSLNTAVTAAGTCTVSRPHTCFRAKEND